MNARYEVSSNEKVHHAAASWRFLWDNYIAPNTAFGPKDDPDERPKREAALEAFRTKLRTLKVGESLSQEVTGISAGFDGHLVNSHTITIKRVADAASGGRRKTRRSKRKSRKNRGKQ